MTEARMLQALILLSGVVIYWCVEKYLHRCDRKESRFQIWRKRDAMDCTIEVVDGVLHTYIQALESAGLETSVTWNDDQHHLGSVLISGCTKDMRTERVWGGRQPSRMTNEEWSKFAETFDMY